MSNNEPMYDKSSLPTQVMVNAKGQRRTYYLAPCTQCGGTSRKDGTERWLQSSDLRTTICSDCQQVNRGKKGFQVACDNAGGFTQFMERLAVQFRGRASSPERQVMCWLDEMNIPYVFQQTVFWHDGNRDRCYIVDFMIGDLALEVNGVYVHSNPERQARDTHFQELMTNMGYSVAWVTDEDIDTRPTEVLELLQAQGN